MKDAGFKLTGSAALKGADEDAKFSAFTIAVSRVVNAELDKVGYDNDRLLRRCMNWLERYAQDIRDD